MSISYMYLFRLGTLSPIKNGCLFIKHYINATSFKIIQLDARTGCSVKWLSTGKASELNFSLPKSFSKSFYWWKGIAKPNFLNFHMTFSISPTFASKVARCGFSGTIPSRLNKDLEKISTTAALDKDENLLRSGL